MTNSPRYDAEISEDRFLYEILEETRTMGAFEADETNSYFLENEENQSQNDECFEEPMSQISQFEKNFESCTQANFNLPAQEIFSENVVPFISKATQKPAQFIPQELKFLPHIPLKSTNDAPIGFRIPTLKKDSISKQRLAQSQMIHAVETPVVKVVKKENVHIRRPCDKTWIYRKSIPIQDIPYRQRIHVCSICSKPQIRHLIKDVSLPNEKLIIMIGCVLRGHFTLQEANQFLSRKRRFAPTCHLHFFEALREICQVLQIKNTYNISSCSLDLIQILMPTISFLRPQLMSWEFRNILCDFSLKNKHRIRTLMLSTKELRKVEPEQFVETKEVIDETKNACENIIEEPFDEEYQAMPTLEKYIKPLSFDLPRRQFYTNDSDDLMQENVKNEPTSSSEFFNETKNLDLIAHDNQLDTRRHQPSLPEFAVNVKLDNVKTEPIDDNDNSFERDFFNTNYRVDSFSRKLGGFSRKRQQPFNRRCNICTYIQYPEFVEHVLMEDHKLIIMTGCILRGNLTHDKAHSLMTRKIPVYICRKHFPEAVNEIYKVLDIQNSDEIDLYPSDLTEKLMDTVNALCPWFTSSQFLKSLYNFAVSNENLKNPEVNSGTSQPITE